MGPRPVIDGWQDGSRSAAGDGGVSKNPPWSTRSGHLFEGAWSGLPGGRGLHGPGQLGHGSGGWLHQRLCPAVGGSPLQRHGDGAAVALLPLGHRHGPGPGPGLSPVVAVWLAPAPLAPRRSGHDCHRPCRTGRQCHRLEIAVWLAPGLGGEPDSCRHPVAACLAAPGSAPTRSLGDRHGGPDRCLCRR